MAKDGKDDRREPESMTAAERRDQAAWILGMGLLRALRTERAMSALTRSDGLELAAHADLSVAVGPRGEDGGVSETEDLA